MPPRYGKRFDSLRDRDKALQARAFALPIPFPLSPIGKQPSNHQVGTIGYFADQLRQRPDTLISALARAGVRGLTPNHYFDDSAKQKLLEYYRAQHAPTANEVYRDDANIESKIQIVQTVNLNLLRQLSTKPTLLYSLEPRRFEELVAKLLEDQGCEVTLTKRTRDGGYDIFGKMRAGPADLIFLAECKRYAPENRVGVEVIRGLYGVTEMQRANLGLVITTSSFTKDARQEKLHIGPRIDLKEYSDLCNWLSPYGKSAA